MRCSFLTYFLLAQASHAQDDFDATPSGAHSQAGPVAVEGPLEPPERVIGEESAPGRVLYPDSVAGASRRRTLW